MKGISLPIETIVIVSVAVLVLVVVVAFFVLNIGVNTNTIANQQALKFGCTQLVSQRGGCASVNTTDVYISGFNSTCGGNRGATLDIACCNAGLNPIGSAAGSCKVVACGCPPQ